MAAPTDIYVDPAIAADSGTGTSGDPYGDLQYALNTATRDATNGNRFNIKAGTEEVLAGTLSYATYGTPTADAPLFFQGYTSAAGDGGIGVISGAATYGMGTTPIQTHWRDLRVYNSGAAQLISMGQHSKAIGVTFDTCTATVSMVSAIFSQIIGCVLQSMSGRIEISGDVIGCYFSNGANDFTRCIDLTTATRSVVKRNVFSVDGSTVAIFVRERSNVITHNSIFSNAGTGTGIELNSSGADSNVVLSNIIAGFSGAGGEGILVGSGSTIAFYGHNYFYNNTTDESGVSGAVKNDLGDNETGGGDPFAKSGSDTAANRGTYFAPLDVGNVWGGAYPTELGLDKGAVQHAAAAGGGAPRSAGMSGGIF